MGAFDAFALVPEQGATPQMDQLDGDTQQRIRALAARIDLTDSAQVAGFGARAQKEMGTFSDLALRQMLSRDVDPLSGMMQELAERIRECSFASQAKGFLSRMLGRAPGLEQVRAAYDKAEPRISALCNEMTDRLVALMRDGAMLERIYEKNESLYRELCSLIVVGEEAVRQAKARAEDGQLVSRMEQRVENLRVTQLSSTQLAAQIRMVQRSGEAACQKMRTALDVTIPLWKGQMAAALGLARAAESMQMGTRAQREAARGIRSGAQDLRMQTDEYARAAGRKQAEQTAQALLIELESIEQALRAETGMEMKIQAAPEMKK